MRPGLEIIGDVANICRAMRRQENVSMAIPETKAASYMPEKADCPETWRRKSASISSRSCVPFAVIPCKAGIHWCVINFAT